MEEVKKLKKYILVQKETIDELLNIIDEYEKIIEMKEAKLKTYSLQNKVRLN